MRFFVLTKKKLLAFGCCVLVGALAVMIGFQGAGAILQTVASPRKSPIYSVQREDKVVSLTFDTAWGNGQTEDILNILEQYEVKSTFFVTGEWAQEYPEMVKAMSGQGYDVCNYSDTHPHMPQVGKEQQLAEITGCNEKIKEITGLSPILFRAPYGDYDNSVVEAANDLGMYCIQWNIDSYDWQDPSPENMKNRLSSQLKPGSIILLHNGAEATVQTLPAAIAAIQGEGYQIVPVSQLLLSGSYLVDHEGRQVPQP